MNISVYRPGELTAADRAAWSALQSKAHLHGAPELANPFLSPEFTLAVGRCRRGVRIAVVRQGGEPVAFFPFQRTTTGVGRAVGLGVSDCQGLVHGPGFTWDSRELLRACGLAVWEFDHLVEGQEPFEAEASGTFPSPVMDVDRGYETYLAELRARSPKFTRTTLAKDRKLGRDHGEVRYVHDERDPKALLTLMGWKSAQYRRTGRSDRFAQPWITRLTHQLFHTRSEPFAGTLSVLYAGGKPVAAHFGLRSERVMACWFPRTTRRSPNTPRALSCICAWPRRLPPTASPIWISAGAEGIQGFPEDTRTRRVRGVGHAPPSRGARTPGAARPGPGAAQRGAVSAGAVRAGRQSAQTDGKIRSGR